MIYTLVQLQTIIIAELHGASSAPPTHTLLNALRMPKVCQHGHLLVMQPISARGKENGEAITLVASAWNQLLCKIIH